MLTELETISHQYLEQRFFIILYNTNRPGPYICAEWEWGGHPYWLLHDPDMKVRVTKLKFQKILENLRKF